MTYAAKVFRKKIRRSFACARSNEKRRRSAFPHDPKGEAFRIFDAVMMKEKARNTKRLHPKNLFLNIIIGVLTVIVCFLAYSFVTNTFVEKPVDWKTQADGRTAEGDVIQLDVLNGCGASGAAQKFTDFLRKRNFDVVQSANYKTFDVERSLVIDRTGHLNNARKVAYALGIEEQNIVQQINPDYYLHVSVVIGHDYRNLKPLQ